MIFFTIHPPPIISVLKKKVNSCQEKRGGLWEIGKYTLDEYSKIPILNVTLGIEKNWEVHSRPIFKNPNFKCYWKLGIIGKYTLDDYSKIPILIVIGN